MSVTLTIANTEINIGDKYNIVGKADKDAPAGFQERETTKYLMQGVGETRTVPYDEQTNSWDTSFDYDSPSNKGVVKADVDMYIKHIKVPYEKRFKTKIDSTEDEFWQDYGVRIETGKTFDTNDTKQLLDLFQALKKGYVCEKGEKAHHLQHARYCIEDNNKKRNLVEKRASAKMDAYATFASLVKAIDKDDELFTVLEWISFPSARTIKDTEQLKTAVALFFDNQATGQANCERFLDAYDLLKDPARKTEMEYFSALCKIKHHNKLKYSRKQYFLNDILVGNSLKEGAKVATLNDKKGEELQKAIQDALDKIE